MAGGMMHRLVLIAVLAAACGPVREDLSVVWTFDGLSCAEAGVATITVGIDGQRLVPDHFSCAEAGYGADLGRYLPGYYVVTVSGSDGAGNLLYQTRLQVQVKAGGTQVQLDALPGQVTLHWTFEGKSCAAAGVPVINASVDNQVLTDEDGS